MPIAPKTNEDKDACFSLSFMKQPFEFGKNAETWQKTVHHFKNQRVYKQKNNSQEYHAPL
jgi:hypothetical protein